MKSNLSLTVALAGICLSILPASLANASSTSRETFPQIVRISYLEGDVRVSRGRQGGAPKDTDWEKAVANLPIQAGFTLATDDGRAEIEFEDSSVVYLAPHSVLIFNELASTGDVPQSQLALLTGTATMRVHPRKHDEVFVLRTPTDTLVVANGQRSDLRVTSYMDAVGLTPTMGGFIQVSPNIVQAAIPGRTHYYRDGKQVDYSDPDTEAALKDWDKWVSNRLVERDAVLASMLKKTGLKEPVPGLAQLDGQGKFVDCPGYGTCWEPPTPPAPKPQKSGDPNSNSTLLQPQETAALASGTPMKPRKILANTSSNSGDMSYYDAGLYFPCGPDSMYYGLAMQAGYMPGMMGAYGYGYGYGYANGMSPWGWAVCHSGSWIYQQNRYLWVPGGGIQHFPPVHWIRHGSTVGFVPIHPRDVSGKPPINGINGMIAANDKQGRSFARVSIDPGSQLKVLGSEPKEFRKPADPSLSRSDAPRMEAHVFRPNGDHLSAPGRASDHSPQSSAHTSSARIDMSGGGKDLASRSGAHVVGVPIVFDHGSQSFLMSHEVPSGKNMRTISEPVDTYLARSGQTFGGRQSAVPGMAGGPGNGFDATGPGVSSGRGVMPGNSGGGYSPGFSGGGGGGLSSGGNAGGSGPGVSSGGGSLSAPAPHK